MKLNNKIKYIEYFIMMVFWGFQVSLDFENRGQIILYIEYC